MADHIKERLQNPTLRFARETAEAQLKRAGVSLSADWSRRTPGKPMTEGTAATDRPFADPRAGRTHEA